MFVSNNFTFVRPDLQRQALNSPNATVAHTSSVASTKPLFGGRDGIERRENGYWIGPHHVFKDDKGWYFQTEKNGEKYVVRQNEIDNAKDVRGASYKPSSSLRRDRYESKAPGAAGSSKTPKELYDADGNRWFVEKNSKTHETEYSVDKKKWYSIRNSKDLAQTLADIYRKNAPQAQRVPNNPAPPAKFQDADGNVWDVGTHRKNKQLIYSLKGGDWVLPPKGEDPFVFLATHPRGILAKPQRQQAQANPGALVYEGLPDRLSRLDLADDRGAGSSNRPVPQPQPEPPKFAWCVIRKPNEPPKFMDKEGNSHAIGLRPDPESRSGKKRFFYWTDDGGDGIWSKVPSARKVDQNGHLSTYYKELKKDTGLSGAAKSTWSHLANVGKTVLQGGEKKLGEDVFEAGRKEFVYRDDVTVTKERAYYFRPDSTFDPNPVVDPDAPVDRNDPNYHRLIRDNASYLDYFTPEQHDDAYNSLRGYQQGDPEHGIPPSPFVGWDSQLGKANNNPHSAGKDGYKRRRNADGTVNPGLDISGTTTYTISNSQKTAERYVRANPTASWTKVSMNRPADDDRRPSNNGRRHANNDRRQDDREDGAHIEDSSSGYGPGSDDSAHHSDLVYDAPRDGRRGRSAASDHRARRNNNNRRRD